MEELLNLNIAALVGFSPLIALKTSYLDAQIDRLLYELESFSNKKGFRLVTFRKGYISKCHHEQFLFEKWKNIDIIFCIGNLSSAYWNNFSEETKLKIIEKAPCLTSLIFDDHYLQRHNCFFNGSTLVYQITLSSSNYEVFLREKLPYLLSAVTEIKMLDISCSPFPVEAKGCGFLCKSKVQHISPGYRPRKSPYPMISVDEAVKCVLSETSPLSVESKKLRECFGLILAEDVLASEHYPVFPASIKDGYAVIANDSVFTNGKSSILNVIGDVTPGCKLDKTVFPGTCIRVSTGSVIPDGADAVIQVEDTCIHESHEGTEISIEILKKPKLHQDIRAIGSDVSEGEVLIPAKKKITPAEIGIMSTYGIKNVLVYKKPWVAVMSTGDEVVEPEDPVFAGCIRDSNKSTLIHMLTENRIPVIDVGIARDDPDIVKSHLNLALSAADIVISTGGVSMGERDILKQVLEKDFNAVIQYGRVHMKPGKPTTFSTVMYNGAKKLIFSLPGNPVSACVCFYLFVIPCIKKMMGYDDVEHKPIKVQLGYDLKLDERPEFCRASLHCGTDGIFVAQVTGSQQSSRLLSMQNADALLVLPPSSAAQPMLKAGTIINAILLKSL